MERALITKDINISCAKIYDFIERLKQDKEKNDSELKKLKTKREKLEFIENLMKEYLIELQKLI